MRVHSPKHKRQVGVPTIPVANGVTGAATIDPSAPTASPLETDSAAATDSPESAPAIATEVPTLTVTSTSSTSDLSGSTSTSVATTKSSRSNISLGTAIAACIGTVAGLILLVIVAFWFYRRYTDNLKSKALAASEKRAARSKGNNERSKKRSVENWNKMEEVGHESKTQTKEIQSTTGMENMTMFQKSPTVRSPASEKWTEEGDSPFNHTFVQYQPTTNLSESPVSQRPITGRTDPDMSWDSETAGTDTFLSLRSAEFEKPNGSALSKAIPTPPAVEYQPHKWESAEVLHFDAKIEGKNKFEDKDGASIGSNKSNNPFAAEVEKHHRSVNNPFFNAQDYSSNTPPSSAPLSLKAQGKQREVDPFINTASPIMPVPRMPFARHTPSDSDGSYNSDRAIQSLIHVLDVSEEDVQERLRIASMQPSFVSASSDQGEEADVSSVFPLPPP